MRNLLLTLAGIFLLTGCEMPATSQRSAPTTSFTYKLPVLTPVEPEKQDQERDGVRISLAPYTYGTKRMVKREVTPLPTLFVVNNQYPAELKEIPYVVVMPRELRFKVKINNRLERVLRLAGTVVSFQVAGKTVAVDKARYEDFLNGIILPRQEGEYEIVGPDLTSLPENATIGLFLYDMVTATDAAGNPTQRSNFEFYYTLSPELKSENAPITVKRVYLNEQKQIIGQP